MTKLLDAGYSIAAYDDYIIVAVNNSRHTYLAARYIKQLLPDYECISWFGKVKVFIDKEVQ